MIISKFRPIILVASIVFIIAIPESNTTGIQENKSLTGGENKSQNSLPVIGNKSLTGGENKSQNPLPVIGNNQTSASNQTPYTFNKNITENTPKIEPTPIKIVNEIDSYFFISIILAGAATGLGIVFGNRAIHFIIQPKIKIEENQPIILREFHIPLYEMDDPNIPNSLRSFKVKYIANRAVISNTGRSSAEGSKGALRIKITSNDSKVEEEELKLRWVPSIEQYTMTINAHSEEYLDVCAVCDEKVSEVLARFRKHTNALREIISQIPTAIQLVLNLQLDEIVDMYTSEEHIPNIIAPTENAWHILRQNRPIRPSDDNLHYNLVVTSRNSNKINQEIKIVSPTNENKKVIEFV